MSVDAVVVEETQPPLPSYICGIGASAGGLEALEVLFKNMPRETGIAFVVVQHLSPDFKSMMNELLARHTPIPIFPVEDGMRVVPDCIYLIPPKKEMMISGGKLHLSDKDHSKEIALPIDIFLRSLAQEAGMRSIAVILSGTGSDGSRGIKDINQAGGFVVSQSEETARFDGMPKSARDTGCVDVVSGPDEIAQVLVDHVRRMNAGLLRPRAVAGPRGVGAVFALLQEEFSIDFSHYKPTTVSRRIDRRMNLNRHATLDDYVKHLMESVEERNALYKDLLIGVTRFFRDGEAFELIQSQVVPELLRIVGSDDELRVWVAGCATGEEAYSLAMILHEALAALEHPPRLKIFATDAHRGSLETASLGLYDEDSVSEVPPERLAKYFSRQGKAFRVSQDLRQYVVFAPHNLLKDAPFTKVHLVTCRNMLIYLQPHAQKKVLSMLHFALKRNGFLFLGPSETPSQLGDDFEVFDEHSRIYRKHRDLRLSSDVRFPLARQGGLRSGAGGAALPISAVMSTYDALLEDYLPPSLLIGERRELIHAFRGAGRFLRVRDGRPSLDVLDLVDPELKLALTGALQRALKEMKPVVYRGVKVTTDTGTITVRLTVRPIHNQATSARHVLISFEDTEEVIEKRPETSIDLDQVSKEQLHTLESELRYTKENLQATIEELETSNEELQATNEELVASNEELQSTNEELQSVNEELYTVNAEYQKKISELTDLTNDMDNLLSSTEVGTIFLDRDLCIRRFTPKIAETFNLLPRDIGRRIDIFSNTLGQGDLTGDLENVRDTGVPIQREICDRNDAWFYLRIFPYRAKGTVEGVVITLIDISSLKQAQDALFAERHLLESVMETLPDYIYFKDGEGRYVRVNSAMARRLELTKPSDAIGKKSSELMVANQAAAERTVEHEVLRTGTARLNAEELYQDRHGGMKWLMSSRMPLKDRSGEIIGVFGVARDITERKLAEEGVRDAVKRRDQFLAMLSHELRNPLGAITSAAYLLRMPGSEDVRGRALTTIERQSSHMGRLLDDLLDVSRVTQNKIELDRRPLDIRSVLNDALEVARPKLAERGVHLTIEIDPEPLYVLGDAARLQQVHVNLLNNACKFSMQGCSVSLSAKVEGDEVVIRVRDTGRGISSEMTEKIFELFVQANSAIDRSEAGMGVGLTLVRALVEMHGGRVHAESDGVGKGSTFTVRLPRTRPASADVNRQLSVSLDGRGRRIVLVEDNEDSREMMCIVLESMGFEVQTATNGEEGAELIERVLPTVALVDIGLPLVNGYQLARRIRAKKELSGVFLVALTGYGQPADRENALEAGFDEHLVKPLTVERLTQMFSSAREQPPVAQA
jgi:two-component system CheB/CheR fusion protein